MTPDVNDPAPRSGAAGTPGLYRGLPLAGLWFGLVCGLLEATVQLAAQSWIDSKYVSLPVLWVAPCLYGLLFGAGGALFAFAGMRIAPRVTPILLLSGLVFVTVLVPVSILMQGLAAEIALVVLAAGLAGVLVRWLLERIGAFLQLVRHTVLPLTALVLFGVLAGPYLLQAREAWRTAELPAPGTSAPNVLLVVVDTLRADHLSSFGYPRATTPWLDQLAQQGVSYPWAYATSPWSLPSHVSLLTGNTFSAHGIGWYNHQGLRSYPGPVLPEILQQHGYRTGAFAANMFWVTHDRMGRGFIHFDDFFYNLEDSVLRTMYGRAFEKFVLQKLGYEDIPARRHAADINHAFLKWLGTSSEKPFFAMLNYMDVHDPYLPPEPWRSRFSQAAKHSGIINWRVDRGEPKLDADQLAAEKAAYDGGIAYVDEQIRVLMDELRQRGQLDNTLVIVTSDHGESFGEHGLLLHGNSLYHEQLHVPLVMVWPGHIPAGVQPAYPVSNASIATTVLELCGLENSLLSPAPSLFPWQTAVTANSSATAHVEQTPWVPEDSPAHTGMLDTLLQAQWQLILHEHQPPLLFDVHTDPAGLQDLSGSEVQQVRTMSADLKGDQHR